MPGVSTIVRRRDALVGAAASALAALYGPTATLAATNDGPAWLKNAVFLGDRLVEWQSPYGGPDPAKCPHRSQRKFDPGLLHGVGPSVRALSALARKTSEDSYGVAADRYAVFFMATLHEPISPYSNLLEVDGQVRNLMSAAWLYGKALSPCYDEFVRRHPEDDAFELRALSFHRALQKHRREDSWFGVGYPWDKQADAQFSCDLGEVGRGLVGYYEVSKSKTVLDDAMGLARFFLTDYQKGSGRGVWSPKLGVWLVGPWPGGGAEHFTDQTYNQTGWGWSCWVDADFLLALRKHVDDKSMRDDIDAKCRAALQWCLDHCQFDDGAHGMFGRDDRWVGMTAVPILMYAALRQHDALPPEYDQVVRPKVEKAWRWLLAHTAPETYPDAGYIRETGKTSKDPPENLVWLTAWTVDALLAGGPLFGV